MFLSFPIFYNKNKKSENILILQGFKMFHFNSFKGVKLYFLFLQGFNKHYQLQYNNLTVVAVVAV